MTLFFCGVLLQGGIRFQNKEKINDKLAEIFAKIGSKENTREVSGGKSIDFVQCPLPFGKKKKKFNLLKETFAFQFYNKVKIPKFKVAHWSRLQHLSFGLMNRYFFNGYCQ